MGVKKLLRALDGLFWGRRKIKRQMYTLYVAALLIPVTVVGVILIVNAERMLNSHYIELLRSDNLRVRTFLSEVTTQTYNTSENICSYRGLQRLLAEEHEDNTAFIRAVNGDNQLDSIIYNQDQIAAIQIYSDNPDIYNYKQFYRVTGEVTGQEWYKRAVSSSGVFWIAMEGSFTSGSNNLCLVRSIVLPDSEYNAVLVIRLSDRYLRSKINSDILDAISLDEGGIVYSSGSAWYGKDQLVDIDYSDNYYRYSGTTEVDGRQYFAVLSTLKMYRSTSRMYVCSLSDSGYETIGSIVQSYLTILLLAILIPGVIFSLFTGHFTGRVSLLREEMHKASNQDYDIISAFSGRDELTEAFEDLKVMVRAIQEKDAKMYEAELNEAELRNEQQIMEYKLLAGQINPHYLYNTLETIRMKALTAGDREVATAIKILGKTLRYVLENTGTFSTTLGKELDYIENYLSIQKLRFGDRINYELKIQEGLEVEHYRILPLLLQPVVENAVIHGLESTGKDGQIQVEIASEEKDQLLLTVSDNGQGMTPEELEELQSKLETPNLNLKSGIGLYNTNQRIRLFYGEDYGIRVESAPGQGTRVYLLLPAVTVAE